MFFAYCEISNHCYWTETFLTCHCLRTSVFRIDCYTSSMFLLAMYMISPPFWCHYYIGIPISPESDSYFQSLSIALSCKAVYNLWHFPSFISFSDICQSFLFPDSQLLYLMARFAVKWLCKCQTTKENVTFFNTI